MRLASILALLLAASALAKDKPSVCSVPTSQECVTAVTAKAKKLRSRMKNPDSFKLSKAYVTDQGWVCYRYSAQNGMGLDSSGVAVWFSRGTMPFSLAAKRETHVNEVEHDFVDSLEKNAWVTQQCGAGTPLDAEAMSAALENNKDF